MPCGYLVVGAGFSGAVIARELAMQMKSPVDVIERRSHIAGNCQTERDKSTGIMIHRYGPHILNTNEISVWNYVNQFDKIIPFANHVKAVTPKGVFSFPINLMTINQFFGKNFTPDEAREFLGKISEKITHEATNFEEQALKMVGRELYENFLRGYTIKQWGCAPKELPASILKRLPIRFNYNDVFYEKKYQGIPQNGYTSVIEKILDHPLIKIHLNTPLDKSSIGKYRHVFYTGPLDEYFAHKLGALSYRTITFERLDGTGDFQGNAVINYTSEEIPWTRIHEHKHFTPWEEHEKTIAFREFSKEAGTNDEPYYPKRLSADLKLLREYRKMGENEKKVTFMGRLATYRYLDMETVIHEALSFSKTFFSRPQGNWPSFPNQEAPPPNALTKIS